MMGRSRDCAILRPVLVALVYEEPHPEMARLRLHIKACDGCRAELEQLREAEGWISGAMMAAPCGERIAGPRGRGPGPSASSFALKAAAMAAALLVVALIFVGGSGRSPQAVAPVEVASLAVAESRQPYSEAYPMRRGGPFGVDPVDIELDAIESQVLALRERW